MADDPSATGGTEDPLERRLATILAADVAGYSRMIGESEDSTIRLLRRFRAIFDALLAQHHGRVFNTAGDMILAEFPSAVEAVRCATEIQEAIQTKNEGVEASKQMAFRMGINLGDVVVEGGDLLGDGVNVAARLQTVAEPGGICISGSVYDQILNKLSLQFAPLGERQFKNIARPVRTYSITPGGVGVLPPPTPTRAAPRHLAIAFAAAAVLSAAGIGGYWVWQAHVRDQEAQAESLAKAREAQDMMQRANDELKLAAEERAKRESAGEPATRAAVAPSAAPIAQNPEAAHAASSRSARAATSSEAMPTAGSPGSARTPAPTLARASTATVTGKAATGAVASAASVADGDYRGQVCNFPQDPARRICWKVPLQVHDGEADATWSLRASGRPVHMHAALAADGGVRVTMEGWKPRGGDQPLAGAMAGNIADGRLDVDGRWSSGARVDGHWERVH